MSKLEQLIIELCPNGVDFASLGEVCSLVTGATPSKTNPAFWENGTIPWMSSGEVNNKTVYNTETKITQLGYEKTSTTLVPVHSIVIALAGQGKTRGKVAITEIELCTNQSLCSIICGDRINYKFLYHYLDSKYEELREISNGDGTRGGLSLRILKPYIIPVPPLEVQAEIVKILDEYTESVTALQQELEKELAARKKQYEYYRDLLLDFGVHGRETSECEWRTLGDVAEVTDYVANGSFASLRENVTYKRNPDFAALIRTVDFSNGFDRDQMIYIDENAYKFLEKSRLFGGEIIINNIGAGVGNSFLCPMLDIKMSLAPNAVMLKTNNNKFYFYWLNSKYGKNALSKIISKSAMPKFNKTGLRGIMIPVPPIDEQERIVSILDRFDKLCNDISEGLPAEIEARRKQYEYYRDKLLSFEEVKM